MKLNTTPEQLHRFVDVIREKIAYGRINPSPISIRNGKYKCVFTDKTFQAPNLDSSNCIVYAQVLSYAHDMSIFTIDPEVLRRIREWLMWEDEWVIITTEAFTGHGKMYTTWRWIVQNFYNIRSMAHDLPFVSDLREWSSSLKLAMTGDWSSDAVYEVRNNRLDVPYMIDTLNYILDVKEHPLQLHYVVTHTQTNPNGRNPIPKDVWGVMITSDLKQADDYLEKFKSKWWTMAGGCEMIEQGQLTFDNPQAMYKTLKPFLVALGVFNDRMQVDLIVQAGIRCWNIPYDAFNMRFENPY